MARRKQEAALQQEIETQEEWEEIMAKEGVWVIDVYQDWCGPCASMISHMRRLKNELGDELLHFGAAKADTIDTLDKYKGHCEPTFLFYAGGVLVSVIRGSNSPLILRTITEQLAQERKVIDGNAERKEVKDPLVSQSMQKETSDMSDEEGDAGDADEKKKEVTIAIIKPDVILEGKADDIIEQMKESGIEILKQEERQLTDEECREFYSHMKDEDIFEELIKYMTSGPCIILVLSKGRTGENIIKEWREFIGPTSVDEAKENSPNSLRAKYGSENFMNAVHGSDSSDSAARELAFFFPDYVQPAVPGKAKLQRTVALIRPDAFKSNKDEILEKIAEAGFKIAVHREMNLTKDQAEDFYSEHKGQPYFEELTSRMASGPLLALGLAREDAIAGWRSMLGPKELADAKENEPDSLRAKFAVDGVDLNQLHGSDSEGSAQKELDFFFPMEQTVAAIKPDAYGTKDEIIERIHEAGFRIAARKETTLTKELAEEFYADVKDKDFYDDLVEHMTSGPTYFMVLSRECAVDGWRQCIGSTDPTNANEENPDSLRALYGKSAIENALHGSSNREHVQQSISRVFGDMSFNPDGSARGGPQQEEEAEKSSSPTPGSPKGSKPGSPAPGSPKAESRSGSPKGDSQDDKPSSPKGSKPGSPTGSRPGSAKDSKPGSPKGSKPGSPKGSKPGSPTGSKPGSPKAGSRPASGKEESQTEAGKDDTRPESGKDETRPESGKDETRPESGKDDAKPESAKGGSRPTSGKEEDEKKASKPNSPEPESKEESSTEKTEDTTKTEESSDKKDDDPKTETEKSDMNSNSNANTSGESQVETSDSKDDSDDKTESKTETDNSTSENKTEESENKSSEQESSKSEKEKSDVKDDKTD